MGTALTEAHSPIKKNYRPIYLALDLRSGADGNHARLIQPKAMDQSEELTVNSKVCWKLNVRSSRYSV